MEPLLIDEDQQQKTKRGWGTATHWKIACLLTMAVLLALLLIFITLSVSGRRLCGAQRGKTYVWIKMFICGYGTKKLACTARILFQRLYLILPLSRSVWVSICLADESLVRNAQAGKLPKCCKTTSYCYLKFTVALVALLQLLVEWSFKLLAFETSCRCPAFSLLWLTRAFLRQLMRILRNYHASVHATHLLTPSPLPPLPRKSGLSKEKSRPSNVENAKLFQWGSALLFQSVKRLVRSRAQIITENLVEVLNVITVLNVIKS